MVNNIAVPLVPKVVSAAPEKSIQEQEFTQHEKVQKPTEIPPQGKQKQVPRVQSSNGVAGRGPVTEKKVAPPPEEPPRYKPANVAPPPVMNEIPHNRSNHGVHESNGVSDNEGINGKDVDEYSREPTPGFDVLVDNELGDSEYYPNEEQFGRGHDFDMGRSAEYDVDNDMYHDQRDFDHYNKEGFGRTRYPSDESPDQFDRSDLRHRLSKQRRDNNVGSLRSVISREHQRDRRLDSGPFSSRLQGRIKIPRRVTSPGYEHGSMVEREIDMGRQQRSRYSPGRPSNVSSNHSRFRDRIKGRSSDDYRGYRGNDRESAGPKSSSNNGQNLGKTESQQSEEKVSFEGPKPLSEILKRKRGSVISFVNNEDNKQKEIKETPSGNGVNADNVKSTDGQAYLNQKPSDVVNKAGSIDEDAMLDQELEAYDHGNRDYDYEPDGRGRLQLR